MSKFYEVEVITKRIFLVEVGDNQDEEDAEDIVYEEELCTEGGHHEWNSSAELTLQEDIDSAKRHADKVLSL